MKRNPSTWLLAGIIFFSNTLAQAQTLDYIKYNVPVYRFATDQRYSEHKHVFYAVDIDEKLANKTIPSKVKFNIDSFRVHVGGEMVHAGISWRVTKPDLTAAIIIEDFTSTITSPTNMMGVTGYSITLKGKLHLLNKSMEPYEAKNVEISEMIELKADDLIKNNFSKDLTNKKAQENYTLLIHAINKIAMDVEDKCLNAFKKREIVLTAFFKPEKKHPELSFLESLNTRLLEELNKKSTTNYKEMIVSYEKEIIDFMNKEWPKGYDVKKIKVAGHYTLAYLYYLSYDTGKLKQTLDFLYENSNKFLGNRIQYNERKPLMQELEAYQASLNAPKISSTASAGGK